MDPRDAWQNAHPPVATPWPTAQPSIQQFQQAAAGFVLPGAQSGHAPMAAADGFVGTPPAPEPRAQWAFPTPSGLQLVQHGASQSVRAYPPAAAGPPALQLATIPARPAGPMAGAAAPQMRSRLRWETIVPFVAIVCFVAAACLVVADFDAISGKGSASTGAASVVASGGGDVTVPKLGAKLADAGATPKQRLADATRLLRAGSFEEASATLDPLLASETPPPAALRVDARITAATIRNTQLLRRLTRQQSAKDWTGALVTLQEIKRLRPLSASLLADARQARAKLLLAKTRARARARVAAPSVASSQPAPVSGGMAIAAKSPPAARPPSVVATGSLPPRPDAPNTGGGGTGGVTGGPMAGHEGMPGM